MADPLDDLLNSIDTEHGGVPKSDTPQIKAPSVPVSTPPTSVAVKPSNLQSEAGNIPPATTGVGGLDSFLDQIDATPRQTSERLQRVDPQGSLDDTLDAIEHPDRPSLGATFGKGFVSGVQQFEQMPTIAKGMFAEATGDEAGAMQAGAELAAFPQEEKVIPDWTHIHKPDDFAYWLTERLGEQSVNLMASISGAGVAGAATNLVGKRLAMSQASRSVLASRMQVAGGLAVTVPLETSSTAEEQFKATGSFQPGKSLVAGTIKGALEFYTPFKFMKEVNGPIPSIVGYGLKSAGREAVTEGLQESIDIGLRSYTDPNYPLFSSQNAIRLTEAMATGGAVGKVAGVGVATLSKAREKIEGQKGYDRTLSLEEIEFFPEPGQPGVLTWLRNRKQQDGDADVGLEGAGMVPPEMDSANMQGLVGGLKLGMALERKMEREADRAINIEDDHTPRYFLKRKDGTFVRSALTATGVERELALDYPQKEKPEIWQIDMNSLVPAGISASLEDLVNLTPDRITFLPHVKDSVKAEMTKIVKEIAIGVERYLGPETTGNRNSFYDYDTAYNQLLDLGLRVVPNPGTSFAYGGTVKGKKLDNIPNVGRSALTIPAKSIKGGIAPRGTVAIPIEAAREYLDQAPVAIDLDAVGNKGVGYQTLLRSDNVKDWSPTDLRNMKVAAQNLTPAQADRHKRLIMQAHADATSKLDLIDRLEKLAKAGIALQPNSNFAMLLSKDMPGHMLTHGAQRSRAESSTSFSLITQESLATKKGSDKTKVLIRRGGVTDYQQKRIDLVSQYVKEAVPLLDALATRAGIKKKLTLSVYPVYGESVGPHYTHSNEIRIPVPEQADVKLSPINDLYVKREHLLVTLVHELGHAVTLHSFENLDPAMRRSLWMSYQRAMIRRSRFGEAEHLNTIYSLDFVASPKSKPWDFHYLKFDEWMAEQYRRWFHSSAAPKSDLEKHYAAAVKDLTEMYDTVLEFKGKYVAEDLFTSDWAFDNYMSWLEATAYTDKSPMMLKRLFGRVDSSFELSAPIETAISQVRQVLMQMQHLVPEGVSVQVVESIEGQPDYAAAYLPGQKVIQLALGALDYKARTEGKTFEAITRQAIAHEAFHAIQHTLTNEERRTLLDAAKAANVLDAQQIASYRADYTAQLKEEGIYSPELVEYYVNFELISHLIESRANGKVYPSKIAEILDRLLEMIKAVADVFIGSKMESADAIITAFYKGEVAKRIEPQDVESDVRKQLAMATHGETVYDEVKAVDTDLSVGMHFSGIKTTGIPITAVYDFYPPNVDTKYKNRIGFVNLARREGKGYEVEYVEINDAYRGQGYFERFYAFVEQDLTERTGVRVKMKPSGLLTEDGFRKWSQRAPEWVKWHVFHKPNRMWMSPNYIIKNKNRWAAYVQEQKLLNRPDRVKSGQELLKTYTRLEKRVKAEAWKDPKLKMMFMRQHQISSMVAAQQTSESDLQETLGAVPETSIIGVLEQSAYTAQLESQIENAKVTGVPVDFAAPAEPEMRHLKRMASLLRPGHQDPNVARYLKGVMGEADRISWFSKMFIGLKQLAWRNPQNPFLSAYVGLVEQWNAKRMQWISRADDPARRWHGLGRPQADALSEVMFWATEMNYRSRLEIANNVVRQPTVWEIRQQFTRMQLNPEAQQLFWDIIGHEPSGIKGIFGEFLDEIEQISIANIRRTFLPGSAQLNKALLDLTREMAQLRQRPYFPLARFGRHTITVRDPVSGNVTWFSAYASIAERDAAVRQVARANPGDLSIGLVPEEAMEFMGLPAPLLRLIKANLPGITAQQSGWLDNMQHLMSPERSFRKRWLQRKGTPGYSRDGLRAFSHYFLSGANYLSRIEYKDQLQDAVDAIEARAQRMPDSRKATQVLDYVRKHMRYIMEGGRDWVKIKALTSIWQLGFSPAAIMMNLTQVPLVTEPYLSNIFGGGKASAALLNSIKTLKQTFGYPPANASPGYIAMREEMIEQGKIETGQAPELGGFAEGSNLQMLQLGTTTQKIWQNLSYWSMLGFSWAERFNRETTFHAAYHLGLKDPTNAHMRQLELRYFIEIGHLMAKHSVTHEEALAFIAARDAVDATQFIYAPWARPRFLRGPVASTMLIFFQYTQSMLFALGNNPGKAKMLFYMMALYGLAGLPGSDDLDKVIRALSRRILGKDFSPHESARKLTRDFTRGTFLDEVGPDLAMHGISRYGFGFGLLPDGFGAPRFDASANGSMGRIVPGLNDVARAAGNYETLDKALGDLTKDASGAGLGQMFVLLQWLGSDPQSNEQKAWEKIMPRAFKAASKAYRYYTEGVETNSKGVPIARFDKTDPDDLATMAAQLAGFSPEKITSKWESIIATVDKAKFYRTQRNMLFSQMDIAVMHKDAEAKAEVLARIRAFNDWMDREGIKSYKIGSGALKKSLEARARSRATQERGLPPNKMDTPISKQVQDLYPGTQFDQRVPDVE